jgi:hypothetical protein
MQSLTVGRTAAELDGSHGRDPYANCVDYQCAAFVTADREDLTGLLVEKVLMVAEMPRRNVPLERQCD